MTRALRTYMVLKRSPDSKGTWIPQRYLHIWTDFYSPFGLDSVGSEAHQELKEAFHKALSNTEMFPFDIEIHTYLQGHFKVTFQGRVIFWERSEVGWICSGGEGEIQDVTDDMSQVPDEEIIKRSKTKDHKWPEH